MFSFSTVQPNFMFIKLNGKREMYTFLLVFCSFSYKESTPFLYGAQDFKECARSTCFEFTCLFDLEYCFKRRGYYDTMLIFIEKEDVVILTYTYPL